MINEVITPQEHAATQRLISNLQKKMLSENPGTMHRDAHPKQHGLVKACFEIEPLLPQELSKGIFVSGKKYEAWIRFSNQNAPPLNDYKRDIRGAAIKLINIPGKKIPMANGNSQCQDFITISTPVFLTNSLQQFSRLVEALVKNKLRIIGYFICNPRVAINLIRSSKKFYSPLEARYWSATPYKLGDHLAVKYSLIPHAKPTHLKPGLKPDFLRDNMVKQLASSDYQFDFCIQLQKNPKTMPIENPSKQWQEAESPFLKVATLTIPKQTFDTPKQNTLGRDMSFNPWHSLPAHAPLGSINRARRTVYETLFQFRQNRNRRLEAAEPKTAHAPSKHLC